MVSLTFSHFFSLLSPYPCPSPIPAVTLSISHHRRWDQRPTRSLSLSLSPFFPPLSIPMPLTHLNSITDYQSSSVVRSTIDTVSLFLSIFSLFLPLAFPSSPCHPSSSATPTTINQAPFPPSHYGDPYCHHSCYPSLTVTYRHPY